jgi:CHAT domain-containing protein
LNDLIFIGLLVLFGLLPHWLVNLNPTSPPRTNYDFSVVFSDDPEQLFAEAMKQAEVGDRIEANKRLDEACLIWLERAEPERAARARVQIGDLYRNDKRFDESLSQYHRALAIEGLSTSFKSLTYDSIGQIYAEIYQWDVSERIYQTALSLARESKDYVAEAQVHLNLATLNMRKGDFLNAMDLVQSAVDASIKSNDERKLALALGFLGQIELKNGRTEKGRSDINRAMSLYREQNDRPAQSKIQCFVSGVSLSEGNVALAREQAESGLKIAEEMRRSSTSEGQKLRANALRWPCWLALARVQRAAHQQKEAVNSYFRAVSGTVIDWWMIYSLTDRSAIGFAEEGQTAYRELIDLFVDMGQTEEAYNAYEQARVRMLSGLIRSRYLFGAPTDSKPESKVRALSTSITGLRTKLLSPSLNRSQREQMQREVVEAEDQLKELQIQRELNTPKRRLVFSPPATLRQLQSQLLREDESLLEFSLGERRSFAWLISRGGFTFEILPSRREVEARVRQYLNELSVAPPNLYLQSKLDKQRVMAEEVFKMLFVGKLASQLRTRPKVIVIPDGLLNQMPFDSLVSEGRYLLQDLQISYLPSANLIEILQQAAKSDSNRDVRMDLLAFGDPVFPQRITVSNRGNRPSVSSNNKRQALEWDLSSLSRLPRTRDEVEFIANLVHGERKHVYLGKESSEKAFKQESSNKYKWIHLATHGLLDERDSERSAVALALDKDNAEDGFLRATEIADLDLDCDLVTLSACETGRGQLSSGEGIVGLSRSFFIAGARSVVVSQWAVSDTSTAQLMKDFYQQMVNGVGKPAALREAKLRMFNSRSVTRHPYYWAPFVIIGTP